MKKHNLCFGVFQNENDDPLIGFMTKKDAQKRYLGDFMGTFDKEGYLLDTLEEFENLYGESWGSDSAEQDFVDAHKYWLTVGKISDKYDMTEISESLFEVDEEDLEWVVNLLKDEGLEQIDTENWNIF